MRVLHSRRYLTTRGAGESAAATSASSSFSRTPNTPRLSTGMAVSTWRANFLMSSSWDASARCRQADKVQTEVEG